MGMRRHDEVGRRERWREEECRGRRAGIVLLGREEGSGGGGGGKEAWVWQRERRAMREKKMEEGGNGVVGDRFERRRDGSNGQGGIGGKRGRNWVNARGRQGPLPIQ